MVFDLLLEEQFQAHRGLSTGGLHACSMLITMEGKKQGDGGSRGGAVSLIHLSSNICGSICVTVMLYV